MKFSFKYSTVVIMLALYVPFEVLFLKYLPVSDKIYSALRFIPELMIYFLLLLNIIHTVYHRKWISKTPIDFVLLLFIISAVISIIVNRAPFLLSVIGMRPLLRYVALFYLISNIDIPVSKIKILIVGLILVGGLQSVLISYQHFAGINKVFMPRATDLEVEGVQTQFKLASTGWGSGREQGAGIGTFGDSVLAALFLVFICVISYAYFLKMDVKNFMKRTIVMGIFLITLIALFYTYSRASVLIGLMAVPLILFFEKKIKKIFLIGFAGLYLIVAALFISADQSSSDSAYYNPKLKYTNPIANITSIFSSSYVDRNMEHSRGWIIANIGLPIVESINLFGYGPSGDESLGRMTKENVGGAMPFQNLGIINDVYWIAMLTYYGFIGLVLFFLILFNLYKISLTVYKKSTVPIYSLIGLSMVVIIVLCIPYTFILRTFAFRSFAFYFWLLAGLVASEYRRLRLATSPPELVTK